jgi:hypothetical protein
MANAVIPFNEAGWGKWTPPLLYLELRSSVTKLYDVTEAEAVLTPAAFLNSLKRVLYHRCDSKADTPIVTPAIVTL